ncbi:MAG: dockerin type I repeat-containing protein [Prevotellaceae bacterium]|nr:dockerin type I repeat-containing protein [Prevotellaceae bacterium]
MKKTLLFLSIMLTIFTGQVFANNDDITGNKRYTVTVSTNEGGEIEIEGTGVVSRNTIVSATINTGENVILIITANEGYKLTAFYIDGDDELEDVDEDGFYTITALTKNVSINAIFEEDVVGDVNGDGVVSVADVNALYSYIIDGENSGYTAEVVDVNGDGSVTTADVVAIYEIIAGKE